MALGRGAGDRDDAAVEIEAALKEIEAVPGGEMDAVPPVHFEVGFAKPGVEEEAGFGWRHGGGAVEGGVKLREHDAALELGGAVVGTLGEIDGGAGGPEVLPMAGAGVEGVIDGREGFGNRLGGEAGNEVCPPATETELVGGCLLELRGIPGQGYVIFFGVDSPGDFRAIGLEIADRLMFGGGIPIGHIHLRRAVGKGDGYGEGSHNANGKEIELRVTGRLDAHALAGELELGIEDAGPKVEGLVDAC